MRGKPDEAVKSAQAAAATVRLVSALRDALRREAGAAGVVEIETHISHVLLAGEFAWKIKKPVNLGFLDFTRLESRRMYCGEELRLNRRTAPELYLAVVPIAGTVDEPMLDGPGTPIEYAVKMRRFADDALLDHRARSGLLGAADADALGDAVATFHAGIARAAAGAAFGTPEHVLAQATQNFDQIDELGIAGEERA
jgi:aminoglycoside phosphotransferase family enzyme